MRIHSSFVMVFVLALVLSPAAALACTQRLASELFTHCKSKLDVDDKGGASVLCADAAAEYGVCADEASGREHYEFLAYKARLLEFAGASNWNSGSYFRPQGRRQLVQAKADAKEIVASRTASPFARDIARRTLKDVASFGL